MEVLKGSYAVGRRRDSCGHFGGRARSIARNGVRLLFIAWDGKPSSGLLEEGILILFLVDGIGFLTLSLELWSFGAKLKCKRR